MKLRKIALSLLLIVSMMVAMTSTAMAATPVTDAAGLTAALAADGEVVLGADIDIGADGALHVPAGVTVTLDLNGYTISQTKAQTTGHQLLLNDGNLTIKDSVGTGKISYTDSGNGGEYISDTIYNRATLVIEGGTIENLSSSTVASNGYPHAVDSYSGIRDVSVTIKDGTIYCAEYSAIRMFCVSSTYEADLIIDGGTIKGAIDMQNGTKNAAKGTLTINDGTFNTTKNANNIRFANWNGGATEYGITASITGGDFDGGITTAYVPASSNFDSKIISGGSYAKEPEDRFIVDGEQKIQIGDRWYLGSYTVTYTDGVDGEEVFADQVITAGNGAETPAFNGTPTREGYTFEGWSPAVAETVTADATYTAQWKVVAAAPTATPAPNAGASAPAAPAAPAPKTGDNTNLVALSLLMAASFIGIVVLSKKRAHN